MIVNRVWQHHFGEGLVRTPNDFGTRGDRPTHPNCWSGWPPTSSPTAGSSSGCTGMILLSAAYRQGTAFDAAKAKTDPDNRLLWRMRPRRLEAEVLRDAMLAVSGTLNPRDVRPGVQAADPGRRDGRPQPQEPVPEEHPGRPAVRRRSVYMFHKRVIPYPLFQAFDAPDAQQCTGRRNVTTVAPQALALLNDPFVRARAGDFADAAVEGSRAATRHSASTGRTGWRSADRRPRRNVTPASSSSPHQNRERSARDPKAAPAEVRRQALTDYCQVLFGLNEFIYVD